MAALAAVDDSNPDLYLNALMNNIMLHHLARFAKAARVPDFSLRDLHQPERERTLHILSAIINFRKFTEQWCNGFVKDLADKSERLVKEREDIQAKLDKENGLVQALKAKIAEDEPKCEKLREENSKLTACMFATKEFQGRVLRDIEELKAEKNQLQKRKEAINGEIASLSDKNSRMRSRIVQSPERIKRTISTMGSTVIEDKKTVAMHEAKTRDLQAKINALQTIDEDLRGCVEQLQMVEKETSSLRQSQKELADLKDQEEKKRIEHSELHLKRERVAKQLQNAEEKLERAQRNAEDKRAASKKTLARLQNEYDQMVDERRDNDKQVEEIRQEADALETKIEEHRKKNENELNELLSEYWMLRHETDVYMETLANKLNMRVTSE